MERPVQFARADCREGRPVPGTSISSSASKGLDASRGGPPSRPSLEGARLPLARSRDRRGVARSRRRARPERPPRPSAQKPESSFRRRGGGGRPRGSAREDRRRDGLGARGTGRDVKLPVDDLTDDVVREGEDVLVPGCALGTDRGRHPPDPTSLRRRPSQVRESGSTSGPSRGSTWKPSRIAAVRSRSSRHTKSLPPG